MTITRAILSVSDKTGIVDFARFLHEKGVELLSTGGTAALLKKEGIPVKDVAEHTGFPEIMDGRVKTLHPKVHGGLLGVRENSEHQSAMQEHDIEPIDMVVINLYPFEATVAKGAGFDECIENIDIGGPSMIRSAAKNHGNVTVVVDPADYEALKAEIGGSGNTSLKTRRRLAAKAFSRTATYDSMISQWFATQTEELLPEFVAVGGHRTQELRYGENSHQKGGFYATDSKGPSLATSKLAHGDSLSYNNLNDASAALELASEFSDPAVAIIKHANPCGVAVGDSLEDAFTSALACDPVSAYGGIIAVNRKITAPFVEGIGKLFVEVMIAPEVDEEAMKLLNAKKKLRLLVTGSMPDPKRARMTVRSINGGFLYQQEDALVFDEAQLKVATKTQPDEGVMNDLRFAFTVAKHVKSNAIVLARGGSTVGIGAGQMSRIDSTRIACKKAEDAGLDTAGAVLASDAFFPFPDNVEMAKEAGVSAIIQPGGSIRDEEIIEAADAAGIPMVFTGVRHFRH